MALAAAALGACHPNTPPMTPQEQAHMNALTDHMTPRCFGRYLIDLPRDMQPGEAFATKIEGADVHVAPMPRPAFEARLETRRAALENKHMDGHPEQGVLKAITPLPNDTGVIFNRAKGGLARALRVLELHGWKNGYSIKMTLNAYDVSFPEDQDDQQLQAIGSNTVKQKKILEDVYARTRGRTDDDIPREPGVCFQNGFVRGNATGKEEVYMDYVSAAAPDVMFHMESDSGLRTETTLLDRGQDIEANLKAADGHTIRSGHRESAAGQSFDEWMSTGRTMDGVIGQLFTLEANSKIGNAKHPLINIDFYNGDRETDGSAAATPLKQASLREAEAVALWDAVTDTLRPRPGGF